MNTGDADVGSIFNYITASKSEGSSETIKFHNDEKFSDNVVVCNDKTAAMLSLAIEYAHKYEKMITNDMEI